MNSGPQKLNQIRYKRQRICKLEYLFHIMPGIFIEEAWLKVTLSYKSSLFYMYSRMMFQTS